MRRSQVFIVLFLFMGLAGYSQKLKPGFNKQECLELMYLSSRQVDTMHYQQVRAARRFRVIYRSPVVGLDNRWDLALRSDSVAAISIRGTTRNNISWLENFYAAMAPAIGSITLSKDFTFHYKLAEHPQAAVHVGWLLATAALSRDVEAKIDSLARRGFRNFLIVGHSQGGGIAYLLTAHLRQRQKAGAISRRIRFKTYCLGAPKPGNQHFAYDYEAATAGGWSLTVVNSADWVPETPMSVQTIGDFNPTNPFKNAKSLIRRQPFPRKLAMRFGYNQLNKPTRKAMRKYQKYLGHMVGRYVRKQLPEFVPPAYYPSSNYMRAGQPIVLQADAEYYRRFPDNNRNVFVHHLLSPYLYLLRQQP
jgi:pimeloyl-ACP methyl ester carboxylesterase